MKVGTDGTLLGAWADGGRHILDIGTGTGLIAMMMAQRFPNARIEAIDIDADACRQAELNVSESEFADRIAVSRCRLQDYCPGRQFDSIVSNPPFFVDNLKCPDGRRNAARHADMLSHGELIRNAERLLAPDGRFCVILPTECESGFSGEASIAGLVVVRRCSVRTVPHKKPKRVMMAFARMREGDVLSEDVELADRSGTRSLWYERLTRDFYMR